MKTAQKLFQENYTYGDYLTWPEGERWELIDGEAYDMSPAPTLNHQDILGDLYIQFASFFQNKKCKVYTAPVDVLFPDNDQQDEKKVRNVVQPDLVVICDRKKLNEKNVKGAPDLVIEVLSPSTASKDVIKKRRLYETHGVK
ncbi:MAG: Uma2 family endonuclease [Candidatus Riflebacteria bacterium]|nr:Uma2 family endonuclease [Candidatus Riflebacteria bacterium]